MLNELSPCEGSRKKRKRLGRGSASGHGGTCCRGHKGQNSRSGGGKGPGFEGGQMPLQRRLPKRGFKNIFKKQYAIVNLKDLNKLEGIEEIDPQILAQKGIIKKTKAKSIKILAGGELQRPFTIRAHKFSKKAARKIEETGGKIQVIGN